MSEVSGKLPEQRGQPWGEDSHTSKSEPAPLPHPKAHQCPKNSKGQSRAV